MPKKYDDPDHEEYASDSKLRHHYRMRHDWHNLIDDLIEEGQVEGIFDDLPGKGRPLNLKRNLFAPELELAHGLLKQHDLKPAWITARQELHTQVETLRTEIARKWKIHEREYRLAQGEGQRNALIISWDDLCQQWDREISELNDLINSFNLKRPSDNLEMYKLNLERELNRAGATRYLKPI